MGQPPYLSFHRHTFGMRKPDDFFHQFEITLRLEIIALNHYRVETQIYSLFDLSKIIRLIQNKGRRNRTLLQSRAQPGIIGEALRLRPGGMPQKTPVETGDYRGTPLLGGFNNSLKRLKI